MKTTVTYIDKNYYVNNNKRTVVCKLRFAINLDGLKYSTYAIADELGVIDNLCYKFEKEDTSFKYFDTGRIYRSIDGNDFVNSNGFFVFDVTGKSTAIMPDEFNVELGKKIALTRAQEKAFIKASSLYKDLLHELTNSSAQDFHRLIYNNLKSAQSCNEHVKDILEQNNLN